MRTCFELSVRHTDSLAKNHRSQTIQAGGTQYGAGEMSEATSFRFKHDGTRQADLAGFRISKSGLDVCRLPSVCRPVLRALLWPSWPGPFYSCLILASSFAVFGLASPHSIIPWCSPISFFRKKFFGFLNFTPLRYCQVVESTRAAFGPSHAKW